MMKVGSFRLRFEYVRGLIGWLMTRLSPGDDTFEVGNVIARYYEGVTHPVIDKYEKSSRSSLSITGCVTPS